MSGLVAGESLPLTQSSATEIGICTSNYSPCLPGRFEIFCGPRDSPQAIRIRRSLTILEYVLLRNPNKNADSVSRSVKRCLSQRMAPPMRFEVCPFGTPFIVSLPNDKSRKDRLMERRNLVALSAVFVTAVPALLISSFERRF